MPAILRSLGIGKDNRLVLSSICLVIVTFFYFFVLGSTLHVKTYIFQYRVTYENIFVTHVINLEIDVFLILAATVGWLYLSVKPRYMKSGMTMFFAFFIILLFLNLAQIVQLGALLTLPVISSLIILDRIQKHRIIQNDLRLSLDYVVILSIVLAVSGIVGLLVHVITGVTSITIERYPYGLYQQLFAILSPVIMTMLVFCVPLKVMLNEFIRKLKLKKPLLLQSIIEDKLSPRRIAMCLTLSILLGIFVALVPHLPYTNPNSERLGVDTPRYVDWLNLMKNQTGSEIHLAFKVISNGDRPLTLSVLFLITEVTKADPFQVVEYSAVLWVPLLIVVTFFLTRQLTANDKISIIASLFSAISFQTLIGIYSGFYANWLALVLGYLGFGLLVKCLKCPSKANIVVLAAVMTGVLLAHTYTWTIVISVAFVFLFILHIRNYYPKKRFLLLYLILSSSIAVDVLKSLWIGASTGLEADVSKGFGHGLGITQFTDRFSTLADTVQTYYGGVYANIAILGLVMYWLVRCQPREPVNIFLLIFMSTALIPLFIGDYVLQSRILYDIPFQIPAAISLYYVGKDNSKMMFIAILLITGYLSLHVLANLGYVPPPPLS